MANARTGFSGPRGQREVPAPAQGPAPTRTQPARAPDMSVSTATNRRPRDIVRTVDARLRSIRIRASWLARGWSGAAATGPTKTAGAIAHDGSQAGDGPTPDMKRTPRTTWPVAGFAR